MIWVSAAMRTLAVVNNAFALLTFFACVMVRSSHRLLSLSLDAYETDAPTASNKNRGAIKGNITSDGIIDDDFESELGGNEPSVSDQSIVSIGEY